MLRAGLRAASRASSTVVERVLQNGVSRDPAVVAPKKAAGAGGPIAVSFGGAVVHVRKGATVLEAARLGGVELRSYCGGNCSCGTCRVEIVVGAPNLSRPQPMEQLVLGMDAERRGDRLACQAQLNGPVTVRVPEWF